MEIITAKIKVKKGRKWLRGKGRCSAQDQLNTMPHTSGDRIRERKEMLVATPFTMPVWRKLPNSHECM